MISIDLSFQPFLLPYLSACDSDRSSAEERGDSGMVEALRCLE